VFGTGFAPGEPWLGSVRGPRAFRRLHQGLVGETLATACLVDHSGVNHILRDGFFRGWRLDWLGALLTRMLKPVDVASHEAEDMLTKRKHATRPAFHELRHNLTMADPTVAYACETRPTTPSRSPPHPRGLRRLRRLTHPT